MAANSVGLSASKAVFYGMYQFRTKRVRKTLFQASNPTKPAVTSDEIYEKTEKVVADLKDKWDKTEEKPAALGLTAAAFVGLWVLNGVVNAVDKIPVVSGALELVGIFVTSWFVYRYLVFGPDREELKANIKDFTKKVSGK